ncbi:MAG: metallophosphoesterase [Thermoguttaceae bacterium]|nr:metallophosphoesterase [Thermoguttaceae bacterium]
MLRRDFFKALWAAGGTALISGSKLSVRADQSPASDDIPFDEDLIVLFSDTHVKKGFHTDGALVSRLETLLGMNPRPRHLLIYGDFAYLWGKPEDYAYLRELMRPVEEAGIRWDLAFGNHDRRKEFFEAFPERVQSTPNVPGKYVSIVETPRADFILLDSLVEGEVQGKIDEEQRAWLEATLASYTKPVFVGAHHPIYQTHLEEILLAAPTVAGYINGHVHYWRHFVDNGLHQLMLPSTGYWGNIGFTTLRFVADEAIFKLHLYDCFRAEEGKDADPKVERKPEWLEEIRAKSDEAFIIPLTKR